MRVDVDELCALVDHWTARRKAPVSYTTALVYRAIVMTSDYKTGRCDARDEYLRKLAGGISRASLYRALADLVHLGLIVRRHLAPKDAALPPPRPCRHHWGCKCIHYRGGAATQLLAGRVEDVLGAIVRAEPTGRLVLMRPLGAYATRRRSRVQETSPLDPSLSLERFTSDQNPSALCHRTPGADEPPSAPKSRSPAATGLTRPANDAAPGGWRAVERGEHEPCRASTPPPAPAEVVVQVVEAHRAAMKRPPYAALPSERLAIAAALARGWTALDLADACRGASDSPCNAANGRRELTWILATDARLAPLVGRARSRPPGHVPKRRARDHEQIEIPIFDLRGNVAPGHALLAMLDRVSS